MKVKVLIVVILFINFIFSNTVDKQINKLIKNISVKYKKINPDIVLKKNIAVLNFKNLSKDLEKKSVGKTIKSLIQNKLANSLIFNLIDRDNFGKIIKELEINASGLVNDKQRLKIGNMSGVELFLSGEVTEINDKIRILAKLTDVETGKILITETIGIDKQELIKEANNYIQSLFQSKYGIKMSGYSTILTTINKYKTGRNDSAKENSINIISAGIDVSYQINKFLKIGTGYFNFLASDFYLDAPLISVTSTSSNVYDGITRYFSFEASGIKLFANFFITPSPVINIGFKFTFFQPFQMYLIQDLPGFPIYIINNETSNKIETKRIIVKGYSREFIPIINGSVSFDYLLSKRFSLGINIGYLYANDFIPRSFISGNKVQDDSMSLVPTEEETDRNGTFSEYQNFNFSRTVSGERIKFNFSSVTVSLAISLSF